MDLFLLKKIIGFLLMPFSLAIICLFLSIVTFNKSRQLSYKSLLAATLILVLSSTPWLSDKLMAPIENNFSAFTKKDHHIDYIVILGCGHETDDNWPATSQLKACSLQRLVEGIRVFQLHPEATIITSGQTTQDPIPNAVKVKQAAVALGIPENRIVVENFPKDTQEEAELIAPRVKGTNVVLVTNADHMPRSVEYFNQQGVEVLPAPASPWVLNPQGSKGWGYYAPNVMGLKQSTNAWYETLGRVVQWLKASF